MKLEHAFFISQLRNYLEKHPEKNIGQALVDMGAIQTSHINRTAGSYLKGVVKEDDSKTIERIKTTQHDSLDERDDLRRRR
jgi:hypothetical protein